MCTLTLGWPKCYFLRGERICINDFSLNRNVCVRTYPRAHARSLGHMQLFATPWSVAPQAPLSMGFPRQEYCRGLPFPTLGYLPNPGIEPVSLVSLASAGRYFITELSGKPPTGTCTMPNYHLKEVSQLSLTPQVVHSGQLAQKS